MKTALNFTPDRSFELFGTSVTIGESKWQFKTEVPGQTSGSTTVRWDFELEDGSAFTDGPHASLLEELSIFIVSRVLRTRGEKTEPATVVADGQGLRTLARWMKAKGVQGVSEITTEMSWAYADYAFSEACSRRRAKKKPDDFDALKGDQERAASFNTTWIMLNVLVHIFEQKDAMHEMGYQGMVEPPFGGSSVSEVLRSEFGLTKDGHLVPIPDDVAIPILNAAARLIGKPAEDVIKLQDIHDEVRDLSPGIARNAQYAENRQRFAEFNFSTIEGEADPWREPLSQYSRTYRDGRTVEIDITQSVRRLVIHIQSACAIVVQGLTGMRAHELLGVRVNEDLVEGLPSCIEVVKDSRTAVRKYYVKSRLLKGDKRNERWLLGCAFPGSSELPLPVKAICTLFNLNRIWRKVGETDRLFISFVNTQGLARGAESIGEIKTQIMSDRQKDFVADMVDLSSASAESRRLYEDGSKLRPHQWRPTFAMFVVRVDSRLMPAIADHFKHANTEITEEGYISKNSDLRWDIQSALAQRSAEALIYLVEPDASLIGGFSARFVRYAKKIRDMMLDEPGETLFEKAVSLVEAKELYIYDAAHGFCFSAFAPSLARCRQQGGYAGPLRPYPDPKYRSVSNCAKCSLLLISKTHREFHIVRANRSKEMLSLETTQSDAGMVMTLTQRLRQSSQIVKLIDEATK